MSASPAAAPSAPAADPGELARLRAELDRLDDTLHDALMARAAVVARVGRSGEKGAVKLRLGRQAAILRRLLARHEGPYPAGAVLRLWLELLAGSTAMQGPFSVAAVAGLEAVAREQFGALTPMGVHAGAEGALAAVRAGAATAAVLPVPGAAGGEWWTGLLPGAEGRLHVVARLPLWAPRAEGAPDTPALVVAAVAPDPSGEDHTLIALRAGAEAAGAALRGAGFEPLEVHALAAGVAAAGRSGSADRAGPVERPGPVEQAGVAAWPDPAGPGDAAPAVLAVVAGFVEGADSRLRPLDALAPVVIGAHAVPFDPSSRGDQP